MNDSSSQNSADFEWDPSKTTATAWTTRCRGRGPRAFGARRNGSFRSRSKNLPPSMQVDALSQESGYSGYDDSSPEPSRMTRSRIFSEDSISVESPTVCSLNSGETFGRRPISSKPAQQMHRSASAISMAKPPVPKPMRHFRSNSIALGTIEPTMRESSNSSCESLPIHRSSNDEFTEWSENANPNQLGDSLLKIEDVVGELQRPRKYSRRKPFQGRAAPLSETMKETANKCFGTIARSAAGLGESTWPPSSELPNLQSPPKKFCIGDGDDLGESAGCSPSPAKSVASSCTWSRKRSVCGSPISDRCPSDTDDWSCFSTSMHSNSSGKRSRSRIFSPLPGQALPFVPLTGLSKRSEDAIRSEDTAGAMQVDSDDGDTEDNNDDSSQESSIHSTGGTQNMHPFPEIAVLKKDERKESPPEDENASIFQAMSSYDDLKFLIKALRKESGDKGSVVFFRPGNSWSVAPPKKWSSNRRTAFYQWTTQHLGFTVKSICGNSSYLQISKLKGVEVKAKLEAALISFKKEELDHRKEVTMPNQLGNYNDNVSMLPVSRTRQQSTKPICAIMEPAPANDLAELTAEMGAVTFKESKSKRNLVRHVTVDPLAAEPSSLRPSSEYIAGGQDLLSGIDGYSPHESVTEGRAPIASACSTGSMNRQSADNELYKEVAPIQSFEIVETPMIQDNVKWGARPIQGRDWGASCKCESHAIHELWRQFKESCEAAGLRDSCCASPFDETRPTRRRSSNLRLEFEATTVESSANLKLSAIRVQHEEQESDARLLRKRSVSFAKHKRMSLWASTSQDTGPLQPKKSMFCAKKSLGPIEECKRLSLHPNNQFPRHSVVTEQLETMELEDPLAIAVENENVLSVILSFFDESELMGTASLVSTIWAEAAINSHAKLMLASVGCDEAQDEEEYDDEFNGFNNSVALSMGRSWEYLTKLYPWARFLSEGAFKKVFMVYNSAVGEYEAVSVMDVDAIVDKKTIGAELAVSAMLSSLTRRAICPNFVRTRGVFTCPYEPPASHWGNAENKKPKGGKYIKGRNGRRPREPKNPHPGRFQYIRMELCSDGDAEEFLKEQPGQEVDTTFARSFLFQLSYALHAAAERFSLKHYDIKLLNVFVQSLPVNGDNVVLRYGLGSYTFALTMPTTEAKIAKLADYGTANVRSDSNGKPVTIAQFTTLENTPPDFMILGDEARQGHGHDCFGLGLCMLHLFTGHAPYEEILETVKCPLGLKKRLSKIYENDSVAGYNVIRSVILADVSKDEAGNIIEGDPDEVLYDTLYRFIVLFGIPEVKFGYKKCPKVWKAITDCLEGGGVVKKGGKPFRRKNSQDTTQYNRDRRKFSISTGNNQHIARARRKLESMKGGMDLLFRLCSFDPTERASAMDVMNSPFMEDLREPLGGFQYDKRNTNVYSYTAFSTQKSSYL